MAADVREEIRELLARPGVESIIVHNYSRMAGDALHILIDDFKSPEERNYDGFTLDQKLRLYENKQTELRRYEQEFPQFQVHFSHIRKENDERALQQTHRLASKIKISLENANLANSTTEAA